MLRAAGRHAEALAAAERALADARASWRSPTRASRRVWSRRSRRRSPSATSTRPRSCWRFPPSLDPGQLTPFLQANAARLRRPARRRARRPGAGRGAVPRRCRAVPRVRHRLPPRGHAARARRVARRPGPRATKRSRCSPRRARPSSASGRRPGSSAPPSLCCHNTKSAGTSQTTASGGSVISADCGWPCHSKASVSRPSPLPTSEPP